MKVLMVSSGFPPQVSSGAERFCYELSKRLVQQGIQVQVATDAAVSQDRYDDLRLHRLFRVRNKYLRKLFFDYYNPMSLIAMKGLLSRLKPDIIHFHNIYGLSSQLIAHATQKGNVVVTAHDYWPFCFHSTMLRKGRLCLHNCRTCRFPLGYITQRIKARHLEKAYFVAPSDYMRDQLVSAGFANSQTIPNAVEVPGEEANECRRLLYVGRLSPEKGIAFLLEAIRGIDIDLDILGDGPLFAPLKRQYSQHPRIHFNGFVREMSQEYSKGGILVLPSSWPENWPYVILEGMAHGLPILAAKVGGVPEMIEQGKTGLLFEPLATDDFRTKLSALLQDHQLRRRLGGEARRKALTFNWQKTTGSYLSLYETLLSQRRKR